MTYPDLDCLFVHAPKADNHYLPFGDFFNITYLPMGVPALSEWMQRQGMQTEIIHLGVEWLNDPKFNIVEALEGMSIRVIALSLYWHYQSYDAIEVAKALKKAHPEAFIVMGGLTAGYFHQEILEEFSCVDGIIRGHAEGSTTALVRSLEDGGDLGRVPNLTYRAADGSICTSNAHTSASLAPHPGLNELVYGDLSTLRHAETYASSFGFPLAYGREFAPDENRNMLSMGRAFFPLMIGRGCPWLCTFCGGNRDTLRRVNGTNKLEWRSHDNVIRDIRLAMSFGYKTMALCFDPTPNRDDYYVELFERISAERIDVDFYFECWGVPTPRFIRQFRRTVPSPESYLALSPDSGNEAVRKKNKQPFFTDADLFASLDCLQENDIKVDIFYTIALPGETLSTARDTARQIQKIASSYNNIRRLMTWSVQLEPGSPQFERPEQFNLITDRSRFTDFYRAHGGDRADTYSSLGYKVCDYFGDSRDEGGIQEFERHLQHLKCMEFCFLGRDPRFWQTPLKGREHCLERRQMLAARRGTPQPTRAIGDGYDYMDALAEEKSHRGDKQRIGWL
jgi:radical SAM superfamily enzyme YgiQ (UPF0313 family)